MGKYINTDSKNQQLPPLGKAQALVSDGAKIIPAPSTWSEDLICVANNGPFECAAYCYSKEEMEAFSYPCGRQKTWLQFDKAKELAR